MAEQLEQAHNAILEQADVAILGAGSYPGMSGFWTAAEHDEKAKAHSRDLARAMNTASRTLMGPDRTCGDTTRPSRVATTRSIRANTVSATEGLQISLTL